ncbi:exported protein [Mycobacteroides abscessus]|nr:exported protein [Mycobacteroides abscessus]
MSDLAALLAFIHQVSGTPYISGGDTARGTDCSGLASWVANVATDRPAFGSRFNTGNQERALLARGFKYGTAPGALVIGWNGGHTAVTLPDGTAVSSGEGGGVRIGGGARTSPSSSATCTCPWTATTRLDLRHWTYRPTPKVPR